MKRKDYKKYYTKKRAYNTKSMIFLFLLYSLLSYFYLYFEINNNILLRNYDTEFHLNRIMGLSTIWTSPISFSSFCSVGLPVNLFYGWLTIYPIYFFYFLSKNLILSYNLFLFLLTLATFLIAHFSFYSLCSNKFASLLFSISYTFSMYRAVCIFYRGALGESIGLTILPLAFLATYQIIVQNKNSWLLLSISFSLLIYTHVLSSLIVFIFILFFYISAMLSKNRFKQSITLNMLKAGICSLILSLAFILPMIEQSLFKPINPPNEIILKDRALNVYNLFEGGLKHQLYSYSIGLIPIAFILFIFIIFFKMNKIDKYLAIVGFISLLLSTKLFPWQLLQKSPINIIQFPWRILGVTTLILCFLACKYISILSFKTSHKAAIFMTITILSILLNSQSIHSMLNYEGFLSKNDPLIKNDEITSLATNSKSLDYRPKGFENYLDQVKNHEVKVNNEVVNSNKKITSDKYFIEITTEPNQEITLPIYSYKGLNVKLNGKKVDRNTSKDILITLESEKGNNQIEVSYSYTLLSKIAFFISSLSLFILAFSKIKYRNNSFKH